MILKASEQEQKMSSIDASNLFAVKSLVAVITGGGTGLLNYFVSNLRVWYAEQSLQESAL